MPVQEAFLEGLHLCPVKVNNPHQLQVCWVSVNETVDRFQHGGGCITSYSINYMPQFKCKFGMLKIELQLCCN